MTHQLLLHRKTHPAGEAGQTSDLELQLASPEVAPQTEYVLEGTIQAGPGWDVLGGGSLMIHAPASHSAYEVFFDAQGNFRQLVELCADRDNSLYLTVCDPAGQGIATVAFTVRHGTPQADQRADAAPPAGPTVIEEEPTELKPDWPEFARLVKDCLIHAGEVADNTGRNRQELFEQIYAQERYAEGAIQENNPRLYRECFTNLMRFADYLEQLHQEYLAQVHGAYHPPTRDDVLRGLKRLERELVFLHSRLRPGAHAASLTRLGVMRQELPALGRRVERDLAGAVADIRRLFRELEQINTGVSRPAAPTDAAGPLAGPG
jgi:hypothetical protein